MSSLRRALSRLTTAALTASLITVVPVVDTSAKPTPVSAQRASIAIPAVDRAALTAAPRVPSVGTSSDDVIGMTAPLDTQAFRVAGVTWSGDRTDVEAFVRTRDAGTDRWTGWSLLESEAGPDAGTAEAAHARGGTQPLITGESDGIQVRVESGGVRPGDLQVDLVASGTSDADADVDSTPPASAQGVQAKPSVHSRASWGADESIRRGEPEYGEVRGAVVHHTAGTNAYTAEEVPQILRGIYDFHVNRRGWNDIGYNVLVDKWGRLWEGRAGGLDKAVIGAHTLGFNDETFGISAMGDYDRAAAPQRMVSSIESFLAWKLGKHHIDPAATGTINGARRPTVIGHRDGGETACPGRYRYAKLPEIRADAKAREGSALYTPRTTPRTVPYASGGSALTARTAGEVTWRVRISSEEHGMVSDRSSTRSGDTDLTVTWKGRMPDGEWAPPGEYQVLLSGKDTETGAWIPSWRDTITVTG